jgi:hypothetical protein
MIFVVFPFVYRLVEWEVEMAISWLVKPFYGIIGRV